MKQIEDILNNSRNTFDLTSGESQQRLYQLTEELMSIKHKPYTIANAPLEFKMAEMLLISRRKMMKINRSLRLGVVFAMWGEQNRLLPNDDSNPNGEDTLKTKIEQLEWITRNTGVEWTLYAIDDGCPNGSGKIAQEIANTHPMGNKVKVFFLENELPAFSGPLQKLTSADDSRKGGAIILGCMKAIAEGNEAVMYTDADNSVHLGQIGLLVEPFVKDGYNVVLGNRKDPHSILVKQENRWGIGIKVLRHMQRMVGKTIFSQGILDTQAAFKLYGSHVLEKIIETPSVYDFSFDSDWIAAVLKMNEPWTRVPFAFIDSFAESASIVQGPMTTWETLLLGLLKSVRNRGLLHNEEMARVIEEEVTSSEVLDLLIDHLPPQLETVEDKDLGDPGIMNPDQIRAWIREKKSGLLRPL